jgi:hypothetical protein
LDLETRVLEPLEDKFGPRVLPLDNLAAVTKATKEIEARISDEVWDRQKRWELKRDVLLEAAKRLAELDTALSTFASTLNVQPPQDIEGNKIWRQKFSERLQRCTNAFDAFDDTIVLAAVVSSAQTKDAFDDFITFANSIATAVGQKDATIYRNSLTELTEKFRAARTAIRKELEID